MAAPFALRLISIVALGLTRAGVAAAQSQSQAPAPAPVWEVRSSDAADLWFHGLAMVGFRGPGSLPYYSADYARSVRAEKRARGLAVTLLTADAAALRAAFQSHAGFESLHFLPLYFPNGDPTQLVASVRAVARGQSVSPMHERYAPGELTAMTAIGRVLAASEERAMLGRYADALEQEWDVYLKDARATRTMEDAQRLADLNVQWEREVAPAIAPFLRTLALRRGVILLSPALGTEGRIVRVGDAVIVAVGWPGSGAPARAPLLAAVRELCFPLVERLIVAKSGAPRIAAIEASTRATIRCGAMLLDAGASVGSETVAAASLSRDYRRLYLDWPADDSELERRFDARFALEPTVEQSLRVEIGRVMSGARTIPR